MTPEIHIENSKLFDGLYQEVTKNLQVYLQNNKMEEKYKVWVNAIIHDFNEMYVNWYKNQKEYLSLLYTINDRFLHLAGHAFLHILHDLTIVLAKSFKSLNLKSTGEYFVIYSKIHNSIASAFTQKWKNKPILFGIASIEIGQLATSYFLVSLRDRAWNLANQLFHTPDEEFDKKCEELYESVFGVLKKALKKTKSRITNIKAILKLNPGEVIIPSIFIILITSMLDSFGGFLISVGVKIEEYLKIRNKIRQRIFISELEKIKIKNWT